MSHSAAAMLLAIGLACLSSPAQSQAAERLAASFSASRPLAQGEWETALLPSAARNDMEVGRIPAMQLRLALPPRYTTPPRRVRIYLSLPQMALGLARTGSLELSWQSGGRFLPGVVRAGQRALLYEGLAAGPTLTDTISFQIRVSGSDMSLERVEIEPIYEIEAL
ncbi:MAG: hypothetical protein OEW21_06975 [Betaproteobacteria bacterium]|nr:hypothetical protein [Betaproteobacteria bacterium]